MKKSFSHIRILRILTVLFYAIFGCYASYICLSAAWISCKKIVVEEKEGIATIDMEFDGLSLKAIPYVLAALLIIMTMIFLVIRIFSTKRILPFIGSSLILVSALFFWLLNTKLYELTLFRSIFPSITGNYRYYASMVIKYILLLPVIVCEITHTILFLCFRTDHLVETE